MRMIADLDSPHLPRVIDHIFRNAYWTRCCVIQEVVLAEKLTFWLHTLPMSMEVRRDAATLALSLSRSPLSGKMSEGHYLHYNNAK
jgi:hypothetical protein